MISNNRNSWYTSDIMMSFSSRGWTSDFLVRSTQKVNFPLEQSVIGSDFKNFWPGSPGFDPQG